MWLPPLHLRWPSRRPRHASTTPWRTDTTRVSEVRFRRVGYSATKSPPCLKMERSPVAPALLASPPQYKAWISPFYSPSICQAAAPGLVGTQGTLACGTPL
jgi:hypothetical protein